MIDAWHRLRWNCTALATWALVAWGMSSSACSQHQLPAIDVSRDRSGFVLRGSDVPFRVWGVNYDHDEQGRLIEDYWDQEWTKVEADFAEIKQLGANVVRIHLQFGRFMATPTEPRIETLDRLTKLVQLAEQVGLYLNLTGLGCYHKSDVPAWYDELDESARWQTQARFWHFVAERCHTSSAIFCYDLMNEPVVPGGVRSPRDWLGPPFAGKHFVQFITLDQAGRKRPEIAKEWIRQMTESIRNVDSRHLITVGMVDWSLNRPGLTSGFDPTEVADDLDFISVHIYPEKGKLNEALETLAGFDVGKPIVIEELFPLRCSTPELEDFLNRSSSVADGWITFYWGRPPTPNDSSKTLAEAITDEWLNTFTRLARRR
jgi:hypothetical protein